MQSPVDMKLCIMLGGKHTEGHLMDIGMNTLAGMELATHQQEWRILNGKSIPDLR